MCTGKPFTFSDDLVISGSRPAAEEILKASVNLICNESKIIGSKLIFKGEADLRVCYRGAGGAICTVDYELPFSQIMEVIGVEEEADCALEVILTDLNCALACEDGRTISVALGLLAQATIREERSVELLADLYSTACVLTPERKSHTLRRLVERNLRRQTARETVETGMTAASTVDAAVTVCQVTQTGEGVHRTFSADTVLTVLYLSEGNEPYSVCRQITVPCQVDLPEEAECFCGCKCVGEVFATPAGGSIEVRFDLEYQYLALASTEVSAVSGVQTGEAPPRTPGSQPSIVLRMVSGERLWDLAKAYNTTMATIMRANDLDREEPLGGKMLLIPKKRA
ncbi:MAG: DUF3794 domain-containing protein [Pseudoflavonifractor sp.]